nr:MULTISPECIES: HNH endonuclease [unclassified Brevibacterium]
MASDGGRFPLEVSHIDDFQFRGEAFSLRGQQGIRKPAKFDAALTVQTNLPKKGREHPYEDSIGEDGLPRYSWRGDDPDQFENVGLRVAMRQHLPIIWFWQISKSPSKYNVIAPVYVIGEEVERKRFVLAPLPDDNLAGDIDEYSGHEEVTRRYLLSQTKRRLHQPVFRSQVLDAYNNMCAVCSLAHPQLLDAAHIIDDSDEHGIASVVNGLALCKIHHAAYDKFFMGIRPDYVIELRPDLLTEKDGPILEFGMQALHGKKLSNLPRSKSLRPSSDRLQAKFDLFTRGSKIG